ncbi:hypothetical protein F53441_2101 [Fusarium austroafricanum]|uniref:Uncharacterized protein n=1 Tax=Fusarium austroafricanum TaxID=2364996 RepID=A0A8H4KSS3_9HYPO|nr:hypothetical protein F53441_2101 [Fusarium austroafricanum]
MKQWHLGHDPDPTPVDLVLCIMQCSTIFLMAAKMHNLPYTASPLIRVLYHALIFQRLLASGLAYYFVSPRWHRASIKTLNGFIWHRWLMSVEIKYLAGFDTTEKVYTGGLVGSSLFAMVEGSYPHGIIIWSTCIIALLVLDKWAQKSDNFLARLLTATGFVTTKGHAKSK